MKKQVMLLLAVLFVSISWVNAQVSQVSGTVISEEDGLPVVGASILVKGTTVGTVTDIDGNFTLSNVPSSKQVLQISFIGMKTLEVHAKSTMRVVLHPDTEVLDEVMVVAYGTSKKSSFTGSAATVSAKSVEKLQVSNVTKALEGSAPGVQVAMTSGQPGSSATIRIRGIGSINASSDPLYVVDGMPYNGNISAINPADIESMTVLKDAASTSLYGARAANGVIMITTKKGSSDKTKVSLTARFGVNMRGVPEYDIMKDPGEYMQTYWKVLKNKLGSGELASEKLIGTLGYNPYAVAKNAVVDANGNLTSASLLYHDDWGKEAIKNGTRQEYTLNVQGSNSKSSHYLSLGYLDDEGIIPNSDYSRLSMRASGDYKVNDFIKLNGNLSYARGEQNSQAISNLGNAANTFSFIQMVAPIYPVYGYDKDGNRMYHEDGSPVYDFGDGTFGARAFSSNQNVVATDGANMNRLLSDNISARAGLTIDIIKGLTFQTNGGYDLTYSTIDKFMTPSFGDAAESGGRGTKYRERSQNYTINELLTYKFDIAENNHFDVMIGHENFKYEFQTLSASKTKFFEPTIPEFDNAITMENMGSYTEAHAIESYLGRINYDFADTYYLSASVRRDGSSVFHKDNRWGTFWSVGGSWRISNEKFMENTKNWLDNLTLRASYGSVGNDNIYYPNTSVSNYYAYKTQYAVANSAGDFSVSKFYEGNPDLTWETSYNMNVGVGASFLDHMFNVDFEFFHKKTKDMLYSVPQPMSSGIAYISQNALTMINKGCEFSLNVNLPMPEDFTWSWTLTGTHYTNKVTDIPAEKRKDGITHDAYYNIREGKSVYDFYFYRFAGLTEDGRSTWYYNTVDENGKEILGVTDRTEKADKYYIGSALPDFQGGITTDFSWKGLDLSIATNYQIGGDIYDSMYANLMHAGSDAGRNWHRDILGAWSEDNKNSMIPVLNGDQNANEFSDRFLISASYFNIRNITLGYTFPSKWMKSAHVDNARLYFSADNVAIFSKRKGMDPRQYISGQSLANYSAIRSLSVGLSLTF